MDIIRNRSRRQEIAYLLRNKSFTQTQPLHAAELDLERKVLENDERAQNSQPREYRALYY